MCGDRLVHRRVRRGGGEGDGADARGRRRRSCTASQRCRCPALNSAFDGLYGPGDQWYWRADFVNEIPDEAIAQNGEWNAKMPTWKSRLAHLPDRRRRTRRRRGRDAVGLPRRPWSQVIVGVDPDPASAAALRDWAVGYWEAIHPYSAGGAYVNFMMDEGQERVKATYGDNYDRLAAPRRSTTRTTSSASTRTSGPRELKNRSRLGRRSSRPARRWAENRRCQSHPAASRAGPRPRAVAQPCSGRAGCPRFRRRCRDRARATVGPAPSAR